MSMVTGEFPAPASQASSGRVLYQMVRADFLERVRRYSFLVTLAAALYLAYAVATEKMWIVVGDNYRGVYNSAWIGALMALCCSTFLSLAGFYVVKNSVQRDTDTRVGQILAATPMRKDFYTLAKTLSNFAVLSCMVGVIMLAAVAMQFMHGEAHSFSLWQLCSPFLLLALPMMLLTGSVALLFETIPGLRGGFGNVAYFFLWTSALAGAANGFDDPGGLQIFSRSAQTALQGIGQDARNFHFSLTIGGQRAIHTFLWNGIDWTPQALLRHSVWIVVALGFSFVASIFFHRFDPSRSIRKTRRSAIEMSAPATPAVESAPVPVAATNPAQLTPALRGAGASRFPHLVLSELLLMLKGLRWWWYAIAVGLLIGQLLTPDRGARSMCLVFAWLWPTLIWSQMGCRESRFLTAPLLFSVERSLSRQLPALWMAGVLLALITGCGSGIRLLLASDWHSLAAWCAGAVFIPSLALALGVWTGGSRAFEAIYTVWWYIGPAHQTPGMDFMGTTPMSSWPVHYALAAGILITAAYWQRRQMLGYV
jgi:hypothetical protein